MRKLLYIIKSYLKSPPHYWIKNILWRFPRTISDVECIFVVGTPRSGTTLLQRILDTHSELFSLHSETAIFSFQNYFDPYKLHFDLSQNESNTLLRKSRDNIDFFSNGVKLLMHKNDNKIFVEKTPQHVIYLGLLLKHFPKAKFIHIVRDGRDCYCSALNHPWIPQANSIIRFAKYYRKCLNAGIKNSVSERVYTIKYEKLVQNPTEEIPFLMKFLKLKFESNQMDVNQLSNDRRASYKHFNKLYSPINSTSINRWHKELSKKEIDAFNKIAKEQLTYFNYKLE
jgi:hypothetical protein